MSTVGFLSAGMGGSYAWSIYSFETIAEALYGIDYRTSMVIFFPAWLKVAVKYKIGIEPSPKIITLSEKLEKKKILLENYKKEIKEKFKAEFLTCKNCKSRLNMKYVKNYNCPLCNEELRNATLLQKLKKTEILVENLKRKLEFETRKYNSHFTGGEQWIVRVVNNLTTEKQK